MVEYLIFETLCLGRSKRLSYIYLKNKLEKWTAFVFGSTKLHQTFTECASNQYTHFDVLICQMWLQVMARLLILLRILGIFIYTWWAFMSKVLYFHQNFTDCVSVKVYSLVYQHAKFDCRLWKILLYNCILFGNFSYITTCLKRYNFNKLCVKAEL